MIEQRPTTQTVNLDDEPIIDVKSALYFVGYVLRSMKRRRRLMTTTVVSTLLLVVAACIVMPRVYKISTRILTHRSLVMPNVVNPLRTVPVEREAPTDGAVELIKSRENLENLMNDVKLQEVWEAKRSFLWKAKDKVTNTALGAPSDQDIHEAFLKLLDERITPSIDKDVVVMDVEWPDADIAMSLAEGVVARFLKLRHDMELSEFLETVNILERNIDGSRHGIEEVVARMTKIVNDKEREIEARSGGSKGAHKPKKTHFIAIRKPVGADHVDEASDDVRKRLSEKQAALATLKHAFEERVKKAEQELGNLRATLGPEHPDVADAKRELDRLAQPPPELSAIQQEVAQLEVRSSTLPAAGKDEPKVQVQSKEEAQEDNGFGMLTVGVSDDLFQIMDKDPEIARVMQELKKREDAHDDLIQRLANARIESETANVAFEYRYIMTMPPVYPKKYIKPNLPLMLGGGLVVALLLGIVFAVAADIMSRRVLEAWQLERFLNLKVLGEVDEP